MVRVHLESQPAPPRARPAAQHGEDLESKSLDTLVCATVLQATTSCQKALQKDQQLRGSDEDGDTQDRRSFNGRCQTRQSVCGSTVIQLRHIILVRAT